MSHDIELSEELTHLRVASADVVYERRPEGSLNEKTTASSSTRSGRNSGRRSTVVDTTMDGLAWLRKQVEQADTDLLREMVKVFAERLMAEEADAICGAGYGERSDERVNRRNGYRGRAWDTRAGTLELALPKLREGSYFPDWLLEPRRRAERAFVQVVAECYVRGVSTRRVEGLVRQLGIERISKSRVSEMAKELDAAVEAFRTRPLDGGPYTYVWLDALTQKVREAGRIANVAVVVATGVNASGSREILGLDLHTSEDGAGWTAFLRGLVARGLHGVRLVISDAHAGLVDAIGATLPGASWQRCRTHFLRNLLTRVPKSAGPFVATLVRSIFAQPGAEAVHAQFARVVEQLAERFPAAAEMLHEAGPEILAFTGFPQPHWRQIWSNNPQERLNKEIRRRTDVVGIFPDRGAVIRLVGMVLAEQHDEWAVVRRYMSTESLAKARLEVIDGEADEVRGELVAAS
jgi:putative transposase